MENLYETFPPVLKILNLQTIFVQCCNRLNFVSSGAIWGFYFGENCTLLASSLVSLEAKTFPSVWLSVILASGLLEGTIAPLLHTHCLPFFLCIISPFIAFSFLLCQSSLCVSMALCCALWWAHFRHSCVSQECFFFQ